MSNQNHPFHLLDYSPWPLTGSIGAMTLMSGMIMWFHLNKLSLFFLGNMILIMTMIQWWRDTVREGTFQGMHTYSVVTGLKWGMILFITSEVLFFVSFFWGYLHSSLSPTMEVGVVWPPKGIKTFDPMNIPLLNTMVLLCSGITVTWTHHSILEKNRNQSLQSLTLTVMLGMYFTLLQGFEYYESSFTISDSIYGSCFFMMTGFHGIHVIIGTMFLLVCLIRLFLNHFNSKHHFGFEAAAWYWHFVDVVWLFLYMLVYWWGS
nr:cytochrome c oxidase subunit III [Ischnobaenella hainana]